MKKLTKKATTKIVKITAKKSVKKNVTEKLRCGLCGSSKKKLTVTECCGKIICDDYDSYVLFSFSRKSCFRNHERYTLCSFHSIEGHSGTWQACNKCRDSFDTEDYVDMGTNSYNFEVLTNPPKFDPTYCTSCKAIIQRKDGGYSTRGDEFWCYECTNKLMFT